MTEAELSGYKEEVESATSSSSCQGSTFAEGSSNVSTAVSAPLGPTTSGTVAGRKEFAEPLFSSESIAEAAVGTAVTAKLGCTVAHSNAATQGFPSAYHLNREDPSVKVVMEGVVVKDTYWRLTGQWRVGWNDQLKSEIEWSSCDTSTDSELPCSGRYQGHFNLRLERCEEQELELSFTENAEGGFNIDGRGKNKFGSCKIRGVVFEDRSFEVVKFVGMPISADKKEAVKRVLGNWSPRLHQDFMKLLQYIGQAKEADWFKKPVDKTTFINRDTGPIRYYDVIKTPMDLQTLRDDLKNYEYPKPDDFIANARLIFTNAWKFNRFGEACFHAADVLYLRFEGRLSEITNEPLPRNVAAVEARVKQHRDAEGLNKRKRLTNWELTQDSPPCSERRKGVRRAVSDESPRPRGRGGRGGRGRGRGRGSAAAVEERRPPWEPQPPVPLSEEEKYRLQERIDSLDEPDLDSVLDFLADDQTLQGSDNGEISLDLDALTPARQRALVDFVDLKKEMNSNTALLTPKSS